MFSNIKAYQSETANLHLLLKALLRVVHQVVYLQMDLFRF